MARLEQYRFGSVLVDGEEQTRDLIVLPGRVVTNWWRKDGHSLVMEDLEDVLEELPARLVVGMGADSRMRPDPKTIEALRERGVEVEGLPTDQAIARFLELDPKDTAAALHLTC
ncbi:MAG: MTH938/NDUFAF3 family protein [Actinomycetota bacterium]